MERPRLRHYIKSFIPEDSDFHDRFSELFEHTYTDSPNINLVPSSNSKNQNVAYLSETLPPKIEAVLHEYIQESLEATDQPA